MYADTLPVDGGWESWRIGQCSVTCGNGTLVRTRECNNPPPANGGKDCVGPNIEVQPCNERYCPGIKLCTCAYVSMWHLHTYLKLKYNLIST